MTPFWLKFTPSSLRARIEHRPHLLKAMSNTGWLLGDNVVRMGVGLIVGVWMARYLGPAEYGLFNYALAFVTLFASIAGLGLGGIVVRDLVKEPVSANELLGTTFLLQVVGGLLAFSLVAAAAVFARPDDGLARLIIAVLGFAMVFKSTEVVKYWFQSRVQSRYVVWIEGGVFLLFASIKVALILGQASLMAFVWASFAEGLLAAIGLLGVYAWRGGHLNVWRFRWNLAKRLLKDSWPLILSGVAVMVYMRIDQIMLGQMLGDQAVGIYSAAVRLSEAWYFVPVAIGGSVFPAIIEAKRLGEGVYHGRLQKLYALMAWLAIFVAIPVTLLSGWIVDVLFGAAYVEAAPALSISIWSGVAVAMSVVHNKWLLTEGLQNYSLIYTVIGALANVILNLYWIPRFGVEGAAWATLCAQFVPVFVQLLIPKARVNLAMMLRALLAPITWLSAAWESRSRV